MSKHILIIDDDIRICNLLTRLLRRHFYIVSQVYNAEQALRVARIFHYDALITDVMMEDMSGRELAQKIRDGKSFFHKNIPILMISALWETENRISGISDGADDYLVKPFEPDELVVRLVALLRRSDMSKQKIIKNDHSLLSQDGFILDKKNLTLCYDEKTANLTMNEADCLEFLMKNADILHSRYDMILKFFPDLADNPLSRALDVMMARIRRKIDMIHDQNPIITRRGVGYLWQKLI